MAKIGSYQFVIGQGEVIAAAEKVELDVRSGVDGVDLGLMGLSGEPFEFFTHSTYADAAAAYTALAAFRGLIGSVVRLTEDNGEIWTKIGVLDAQKVSLKNCQLLIGGNLPTDKWMLVTRWRLIDTGADRIRQ